ncbi:MAG: hypothetical protein KIT83_16325 [Bryobacterales bacterium]|nr:hypothetical protein [Bryobacterales bacterium]
MHFAGVLENWLPAALLILALHASGQAPRVWNERDLAEWATPIAAIGVRPGHFSEQEYYASPEDNYRTYPVYHPDREPKGYWQWLQKQKPKPLVDARKMRAQKDWIAAGRNAFIMLDDPSFRTADPAEIARARDKANFDKVFLTKQGTIIDNVWVVTEQGVMLSGTACLGCHVRIDLNGGFTPAAPGTPYPEGIETIGPQTPSLLRNLFAILFPGDTFGEANARSFHVPWDPDPRVDSIKSMADQEIGRLITGDGFTTFARFNGSPWYMTKIPDLQNIRYSRYIDASATHRLRGPGDIARYGALVVGADSMDFGPHRILTDAQRRVTFHYADAVLHAIATYLWSLEPPQNPHPPPAALVKEGQAVFANQGCPQCHPPPNYTSGKLTPALGWTPPADHPNREDIVPISVGTDPGLALKTRKGTGFYKVPSLRGLWYRPALLHDGSVASLEEMFDIKRLSKNHMPGGWKAPGVDSRAIEGHPFGLGLSASDKAALLAFLRTL